MLDTQLAADEAAIAAETVRRIVETFEDKNAGTPMHVAHNFGMACAALGIVPEDEASAERILASVALKIATTRELSERIAAAVRVPDYLKR